MTGGYRRVVGAFGMLAAVVTASASLLSGGAPPQEARPAAERHAPSSDQQIPNLGQVKTEIKEYYGDREVDGEHYASPDSRYARQVYRIQRAAKHYLADHSATSHGDQPALVFDVDDTTLLTYNYELHEDFGYDPETNDAYIQAQRMNEVFAMPALVNWAERAGYTVFFVTGRPESQRDATEGNLHKVGYRPDAGPGRLFLKNPDDPPAYLPCGAECTTIEYKSGTRKHIEGQGYDIVANFGDQYSDLKGGYADRRYKLPNPMYYLP